MNDRHPAGDSFPADPGADYSYAEYDPANYEQSAYGTYGDAAYATATQHDAWSTGSYDVQGADYAHGNGFAQDAGYYDDPLYGPVPGADDPNTGGYHAPSYDRSGNDPHGTHGYGDAGYGTAYDTFGHDTGSATGAYDTTAWTNGAGVDYSAAGFIPHQPGPDHTEQGWPAHAEGSVQWDVSAFDSTALDPNAATAHDNAVLDPTAYGASTGWDGSAYGHQPSDGTGYETAYGATAYGTGAYDPTAWHDGSAYGGTDAGRAAAHAESGAEPEAENAAGHDGDYAQVHDATMVDFHEQPTATFDAFHAGQETPESHPAPAGQADPAGSCDELVVTVNSEAEPEPRAVVAGPQGRGRRRSPKPRRSALLTVAAPSVAVLGVAGISAASVIPAGDEETAQAAPDTTEVKVSPANTKLDTQLAGLREAGDDFADRASRTQERIDLKKRQEAERKRAAAEAARREALRPKFALPVEGFGISAYFGQAGINWMSVHTGLDFPASYGTPVKAATDGTVRTQWNPAYGNMMIVTSPDGTETWYCHLSSTRIRAGTVQAGDVIGYTGNSGNSTGPHLHFEVRPGGGSAVDPLAWFRSHGLEPS